MGTIFDLIFIAIIVITAIVSAKKGFVRTLLELVGFVAAVAIALAVSTPIAEYTYDNYIGPAVVEGMGEVIVENTSQLPENLLEQLPDGVKNVVEFFGVTSAEISNAVTPEIQNGAANITEVISTKVLRPTITGFMSAILNILLILILVPVFRFVAKLINKLFSFSVVGTLNKTLGAVLGALKGLVFCVILCVVLSLIISLAPQGLWVISEQNLADSIIFSAIKPLIS